MWRPGERRWFSTWQRILLAVIGGYFFTAGLATWGALALCQVTERSEAVVLTSMVGVVLYLVTLLWTFAESRLWRPWVVLVGGAVLSEALLHWFAPTLIVG